MRGTMGSSCRCLPPGFKGFWKSTTKHWVLWESGGAIRPISAAVSISVGLDCYRYYMLPEDGQKWGFLIWLMFSYCGLLCIACICVGKIVVDMIRVPDWAFEAAGQEMRSMSQDAATYHPGLYLTPAQASPLLLFSIQAVEALIQELPKFRLKAVPDDCGECLICLEEFQIGHEVRGLPCAHNFHVECIDQWLRLNVKCPRCRSSVFPDLDLSALSNLQSSEAQQPSSQGNTQARYIRSQPQSESYFLRLQPVIHPVHTDIALETAENVGVPPVLAGGSLSTR
ncbi:hypothetical protein HID58_081670 [Brassica napus]|uniref:RING-type domain-containing protein n=1 Tax=Brassica napus TaxID=3708 RepID=A0ABQ7Y8F3_BRANA|nr:hypothetical protein HID58_081670 [Brassica napus]